MITHRKCSSQSTIVFGLLIALITGSSHAFVHPGILNTKADLDFIKAKIALGQDPWKTAFNAANTSSEGSLSYKANPWDTVDCGSGSNPNFGCSDERNDAIAAYTHALLWYFTGNEAHAAKAIEIMDAWSTTLVGGHINSNARLQAGWTAEVWPRAAEIIRYTYTGWSAGDIAKFDTMLSTQYLPSVQDGSPCENGNWEASDIEAFMNIAVFLDNQAMFDTAVSMWRKRTPAYFYLSTDGAYPAPPPNCAKTTAQLISYWQGQSLYMDGLCQETCRDFGHTGFGFAALINAAETALIQGVDLYGEQTTRFTKTMEFHCNYQNGAAVPSNLCSGSLNLGTGGTWEIAYNHYHNRLGINLPQTLALILKQRPTGYGYHIDWETLTHAELGATASVNRGVAEAPSQKPVFVQSFTQRELVLGGDRAGICDVTLFSPNGTPKARFQSAGGNGKWSIRFGNNGLAAGVYVIKIAMNGAVETMKRVAF